MSTYRKILVGLFIIAAIVSFIGAEKIANWILESILSIIAISLVSYYSHKAKFSDFTFTVLVLYFALPLVNAHYNVSNVPFGEWLAHLFGTQRNAYDRFVHFGFGLLCTYPLHELYVRIRGKRDMWSFILPIVFILALSSLYEIGELIVGLLQPREGAIFVGAQGDVFDATKDMTMAGLGSVFTTIGMFFAPMNKGVLARKKR